MLDWAMAEIHQAQVLVQAAVALIGLVIVAHTYVKTKAVVPTVGALLFLFFVMWALRNASWFDQKINDEFNRSSMPATALVRR